MHTPFGRHLLSLVLIYATVLNVSDSLSSQSGHPLVDLHLAPHIHTQVSRAVMSDKDGEATGKAEGKATRVVGVCYIVCRRTIFYSL